MRAPQTKSLYTHRVIVVTVFLCIKCACTCTVSGPCALCWLCPYRTGDAQVKAATSPHSFDSGCFYSVSPRPFVKRYSHRYWLYGWV